MAKEFKQFLEESKQKSAMLRKQKMSSKKGIKPLKIVDADKPTGAKRLGGGKRITPSNWLKKPNTPDPWAKSKEKKVAPKKEPVKKEPVKKPVQQKVSKKPSAAERIKSANKKLNQKMAGAADVAKGAFHAGMERPKQVAHVVGSALKTTSRLAGTVAKGAKSTLSGTNKMLKKSGWQGK